MGVVFDEGERGGGWEMLSQLIMMGMLARIFVLDVVHGEMRLWLSRFFIP